MAALTDDLQPGELDESDLAAVRAATNQSIFRQVNENLEELNANFRSIIPVGDFVCECADTGCTARIGMTFEEYEYLRSDPRRFAVRPGHLETGIEHVVEERSGYVIVEKDGVAGAYATRLDPR